MKTITGTLISAALVLTALPASAQELTLTMQEGRVTLIAQNVPVSRILAEWARVGQATVLNGEKLTGPPVTLHFENQPEREVLEVLLASASGYIVAPRSVAVANGSAFDRILIMPTSRPPAVSAAMPPQFNRPPAPPVPIQPDIDEEPNDPVLPPGMSPENQPPIPEYPMAQPVPGMPTPIPTTQPRPGMPTAPPGVPGGPGGVQPNPYGPQPQLWPPGVRPPGVRPPGGGN
ncbi:hypothetical protein BH23ACI1_BH23ACI1_14000 [soil metagenome]|nr:hypothetical protein [Acidobacteriota bacterium]